MNFHFVWKSFDVTTQEIDAMHEQTIYGENLADAVVSFTTMHGELSADEYGIALEILNIKEVE